MGWRWIFGLSLALCFSTIIQAQEVPFGRMVGQISPDLTAQRLYTEAITLLERERGRPIRRLEKAKARIEKRVQAAQFNSQDLVLWFNIERIIGGPEEVLRVGKFRCFLGNGYIDEELISICAQYAFSAGDLEESVYFLKTGDQYLPPNMDRTVAISNLYGNLGEADSALATMAGLIRYPEFEIDAGIRYCLLLNDFGLDNEAFIAMEQLFQRFPDALPIQIARAKFLQVSERESEAEEAFAAIYQNPDFSEEAMAQDFQTMLQEITAPQLNHEHSAWRVLFRLMAMATKERPESALLQRIRGDILAAYGDKVGAIEAYEKSLTLPAGEIWETFENLAVMHHEQGNLSGYLATAFASNEAFPDHERAPLLLGTALDMNGQHSQATTLFLLGLRRSQSIHQGNSPLAPEYYFRLGTAYFHAGDLENMSASMDRILLFFPDHAQAKNNYGFYLAHFGVRLDEAKAMVEAALHTEPENANYWDSFAFVSMQQGHWVEASNAISMGLKFGGEQNADACLHAAQIYYHLNRMEDMETYLVKALENGASEEIIQVIRRQLSQTELLEAVL